MSEQRDTRCNIPTCVCIYTYIYIYTHTHHVLAILMGEMRLQIPWIETFVLDVRLTLAWPGLGAMEFSPGPLEVDRR